ncbi:MAG: hypothetical protein ABUT20_10260, partial [Bacteroidota bacterium]
LILRVGKGKRFERFKRDCLPGLPAGILYVGRLLCYYQLRCVAFLIAIGIIFLFTTQQLSELGFG